MTTSPEPRRPPTLPTTVPSPSSPPIGLTSAPPTMSSSNNGTVVEPTSYPLEVGSSWLSAAVLLSRVVIDASVPPRRPVRYYRSVPLKSGGVVNGKDDESLEKDEWDALKAAEEAEQAEALRRAAASLGLGDSGDDEESNRARVQFNEAANSTHTPSSASNTGGASPNRNAFPPSQPNRSRGGGSSSSNAPAREPDWLSGHEVRATGERALAFTIPDRDRLCRNGWNLVRLFDTIAEAKEWARQQRRPPSVSVGGSGGGGGGDDDDSEGGDSRKHKKKSSSKKKKKKKSSHRRSSRSSSSSSDSSSSSSDNSSSSTDGSRRKKHGSRRRRNRKGKKRHQNQKAEAPAAPKIRMFSKDESTGNDKNAFGMRITDSDIGATLCPPGMHRKDVEGFAACITDVAAMPGTYHKMDSEKTEVETVFEGALAMMQIAGRTMVTESQWKRQKKSTLSGVKSHSELITLADEIKEAESLIFGEMDTRIRVFMQQRHYDDEAIDEYLSGGLWLRIANDTLTNFKDLIGVIQHQAVQHGFDGGLAEETLRYYAKKLSQIRMLSPDYSTHLLRTYAFLRDAAHEKFNHLSIYKPLLQSLLDQSHEAAGKENAGPPTPNPKSEEAQKCSHCGSKPLHEKFGIPLGRSRCPFAGELNRTQAKKAAKEFLQRIKDEPTADKKELAKAIIAEVKAA